MGVEQENLLEKSKRWYFDRYFILVAIFNLIVSIVVQMFSATISLYIDNLGYLTTVTGTLTSVGAIAAFGFRIFGGKLCDTAGRRKLIVIGMLILGIASLLIGITKIMPLLFVFRILQMIGYAMTTTGISVAVVDIVPADKLSEGIGYYGLAGSIAQALGPSIALALFHSSGAFRLVMSVAGCLCLAVMVLAAMLFHYEKDARLLNKKLTIEAQSTKAEISQYEKGIWRFIEKSALPASTINFFLILSSSLIYLYLTLYASRQGIGNAGIFFTISVAATIIARLIAGKVSDRFGTAVAVLPGCILFILGFILLIFSKDLNILYYIAGALYGFAGGMTGPALNAAAVKKASSDRKGVASSTFLLPLDIAIMLSSILWGALIDTVSFGVTFFIAAVISVIAMLLTIWIYIIKRSK